MHDFFQCQRKGAQMSNLNQSFTLGNWTVKLGSEKTFIAEWEAFARWTFKNQPGAATAFLLQDPEHPQQLISFGSWGNAELIKAWRERPEFKAFTSRAKELCEGFKTHSLRLVAASEE
jgi:heme-degrading monooxygenase HmoA